MNRLIALVLSLLVLSSAVGCVGRAAPAYPDEDEIIQAGPILSQSAPEGIGARAVESEQVQLPDPPEEPYVRVIDPTAPMVALTFDDGPHQTHTDQILDVLEAHHGVATFFEVGKNVALYPEPLVRMAELGCEIASHSNAHKDLSKMWRSALMADLDTADQAFINAVGVAPTLVRPPYGAVNQMVKSETGRTMITWTIDTEDWSSKDAQTVIDYVQGLNNLDGEIVLMHSIYESTAQAVAVLVPWLQEQGYQLVTVSELMAYYYGELLEPNQFYGYTYFVTHGRTDTPLQLPEDPVEPEGEEIDFPVEEAPETSDMPPESPAESELAEIPPVESVEPAPAESPDTVPPSWLIA